LTVKDAIAALRRAHDELAGWAAGLSADQLRARSGSADWNVAQVLSHLGSAAELGLGTLEAGRGDPERNQPVWDRWNAMSPEEQRSNFVESDARYVDALEALSDDQLQSMRVDLGFLPEPVDLDFLLGMRISEVALHGWDVAVSADPGAALPPYLVPFVLARIPTFAGYLARPIERAGTVGVEIRDPAGWYHLEVRDDGGSLTEASGPARAGASTARMPAEAFIRLTAGRLSPEHTPEGVSVSGPIDLDDMRRIFPGY